jgi:hypothetical protein
LALAFARGAKKPPGLRTLEKTVGKLMENHGKLGGKYEKTTGKRKAHGKSVAFQH